MEITKKFFSMLLTEGIFLVILGILIMLVPQIATLGAALIISIGLILAGIYKLINSIVLRKELENPWLTSLLGVLLITTGVYIAVKPLFSIFALTLAVGIYFIFDGVSTIALSIQNRKIINGSGVALGIVAALIQFILAFLIIYGLPGTALWVIGLLIGVNMLVSGITMISFYTGSRKYLKAL